MKKNRTFTFYVGIDISKSTLDFVLLKDRKVLMEHSIANNVTEINRQVKAYLALEGLTISNTVFGMEMTGIYTNHLKSALQKRGAHMVIESAIHIKNSLGSIRGKTDKIDAARIALFLFKSRDVLKLWEPRRAIVDRLASLSALRNRLLSLKLVLEVPLKEDAGFGEVGSSKMSTELCIGSLTAVRLDLKRIEEAIRETWKSDERLNRLMLLMLSVPSVGEVTALQILISTNEFRGISAPKKFACYAGIAPFPYKSGISVSKRSRVSPMANKKMKSLLHTCAVIAKRHIPDIRAYYLRKTEVEGRPKMLVLNAVRFKLVSRIFACVQQDRFYDANYVYLDRAISGPIC